MNYKKKVLEYKYLNNCFGEYFIMGLSDCDETLSVLEEVRESSLDDTVVMSREGNQDDSCWIPFDELRKRVTNYCIRMDEDPGVSNYHVDDSRCYKIISALDTKNRRVVLPDIIRGRFIDVVAYAVKQEGFYADFGRSVDTRSSNNGYLIGIGFENESLIDVDRVELF